MSAPHRMLQLACHATVLVWLAAYLAWYDRDAQLDVATLEVLEEIARVQPRVEPPSEPEPEPEPQAPKREPEQAADPPAEPTKVVRADVDRGAAMLDGEGAFPMLSCSYEDFRSFRDYARAMVSLGARFVVVRQRAIVGEIDLESGRITEASLDVAFSPRARDYTGEPGVYSLARTARQRFGDGAVVMMLVPRALDAGLFGGIARALAERGERHADFREIRGRYERSGDGSVRLRVDQGVRPDGTATSVDLVFDLAEVASLGVSGA